MRGMNPAWVEMRMEHHSLLIAVCFGRPATFMSRWRSQGSNSVFRSTDSSMLWKTPCRSTGETTQTL
jgi:hypothetical protein